MAKTDNISFIFLFHSQKKSSVNIINEHMIMLAFCGLKMSPKYFSRTVVRHFSCFVVRFHFQTSKTQYNKSF